MQSKPTSVAKKINGEAHKMVISKGKPQPQTDSSIKKSASVKKVEKKQPEKTKPAEPRAAKLALKKRMETEEAMRRLRKVRGAENKKEWKPKSVSKKVEKKAEKKTATISIKRNDSQPIGNPKNQTSLKNETKEKKMKGNKPRCW